MTVDELRVQAAPVVSRLLPTDLQGPHSYTADQMDGIACLRCGRADPPAMVPISRIGGRQLFVCSPHCPPFALPWLPRVGPSAKCPGWYDLLTPAGVMIRTIAQCTHCQEWARDWVLHVVDECPCIYGQMAPGCRCPEGHAR
jgi:hypothetical protein